MSCYMLPNNRFVNVAVVPTRYLYGYLPPQLTSSLQMPPSLAVAPSAVPSLSAAFGRQLTAGAPNAALAAAFGMTFGAQRRSSLPSCVQLREFLVRTRGLKRKAEWTTATAATATAGGDAKKASTTGGAAATAAADQPLYCRICRVTLNAPNQARQHYEGKTHAKRLRLFIGGSTTDSTTSDQSTPGVSSAVTSTTASSGSSQPTGGATVVPPPPIKPEIYCSLCGVSFNSVRQSEQHYKGKSHAKRSRNLHGGSPERGARRGMATKWAARPPRTLQ